jgi:hypothetical protein
MTLPDMRLAPSGPVLGEVPGGAFTGLQLRLAEACEPCLATAITTTFLPLETTGPTTIEVELSEPQPDRRYGVRCHFAIETVSATTGTFSVRLEVDYGDDTWWLLQGQSVATNSDNESVTVEAAVPMTLGSALNRPVPPLAENRPYMKVRATIASSGNSIHTVPSVTGFGNVALLSLAEYV